MTKEKIAFYSNKAKEKVVEAADDVKEFVSDHSEGVIIGCYALYMVVLGVYSIKAMRLAVKQQELETLKTAVEMNKLL